MSREPSREELLAEYRQSRDSTGLAGQRMRLNVRERDLDRNKYEYRFVNDQEDRLYKMNEAQWEVVPDRAGTVATDNAGMGTEVSKRVGTIDGKALNGVLMRKLKIFYEDDQRVKSRAIDETEASLKSGAVSGAGAGDRFTTRVNNESVSAGLRLDNE